MGRSMAVEKVAFQSASYRLHENAICTYARLKPLPHSGHLCERSLLSRIGQTHIRPLLMHKALLTGLEMPVQMISALVAPIT